MTKCPLCGHVSDKPLRSTNQNSYMWGVCIKILSDSTGFSKEEMHDILKHKFLTVEKQTKSGQVLQVTRSTASLNTSEMEEYLARIRQWAAEYLDCNIPEPNEEEPAKKQATHLERAKAYRQEHGCSMTDALKATADKRQ